MDSQLFYPCVISDYDEIVKNLRDDMTNLLEGGLVMNYSEYIQRVRDVLIGRFEDMEVMRFREHTTIHLLSMKALKHIVKQMYNVYYVGG